MSARPFPRQRSRQNALMALGRDRALICSRLLRGGRVRGDLPIAAVSHVRQEILQSCVVGRVPCERTPERSWEWILRADVDPRAGGHPTDLDRLDFIAEDVHYFEAQQTIDCALCHQAMLPATNTTRSVPTSVNPHAAPWPVRPPTSPATAAQTAQLITTRKDAWKAAAHVRR